MSEKIQIIGFTGNKRPDAYNKAALQAARKLLPEQAALEIVSVDELPLFTVDGQASESVLAFRAALRQADAILIASPEYKGLLPAGLKNALAWALEFEGDSVLAEKTVALMGFGRQSETEQQSLRQLLRDASAVVLPNTLYTSAAEKFNQDGQLVHVETEEQLRALLSALVDQVRESRSVLVG